MAGLRDVATSVCYLSSRSRAFHSDADIGVGVCLFANGRDEGAWEINVIVFVLIGIRVTAIPRKVIKSLIGEDDSDAYRVTALEEGGLVSRSVSILRSGRRLGFS